MKEQIILCKSKLMIKALEENNRPAAEKMTEGLARLINDISSDENNLPTTEGNALVGNWVGNIMEFYADVIARRVKVIPPTTVD